MGFYDDRLLRVLRTGQPTLDVRELFTMRSSTRAHHEYAEEERRPTPDELYELLTLEEVCLTPPLKPTAVLFDDVLTNGTTSKRASASFLSASPHRGLSVSSSGGERLRLPLTLILISTFGDAE